MNKQYHPNILENNQSRHFKPAAFLKCPRKTTGPLTVFQKQHWIFIFALFVLLTGGNAFGQSTTSVLPNADVNAGTWSPTPLFTTINTANGVFISSPQTSHSTAEVAMTNPTDPGIYTDVEVSFRIKKQQTGGDTKGLDANIRINGALQGNRTVSTDLSDTFTDITVSWTGLSFTRAEMETLQVVFTSTGDTSAGGNRRTVDIDFVEATLTYTTTQYTLTVTTAGNGTVEVDGTPYTTPVTVNEGTTLSLEAIPDAGWEFASWSGDLVSTNPTESILMNANKNITATFNELFFTISGTILEDGLPLENVSVVATGGHSQTVLTDANGEYTLTNVGFGSENILITPTLTGYVFTPTTRTIDGPVTADIIDQNFNAAKEKYSISGEILDGGGNPLSGVTISATGGHTQTVLSLSDGTYTLTGVTFGTENISITPSLAGYTFSPVNILVAGPVEANITNQNFTGSLPPIAEDDAFCIQASTALDVLANDNDPYGSGFNAHTVTIVSAPASGSASVNPDKTIQFDPAGMTENQSVSFVYRVAETANAGIFDEATAIVVYSTVNDPPVANDNTANTSSELPVIINVLANDTDPEGGALFVDAIITGPSSGSAVINPDNTITYTPFAGFEGTDTFVYRVCDDGCGSLAAECAEATVTVNVIDAYYVCQDGTSTVSVEAIPGATGYIWNLPAGAVITDGTGTNELTVNWSAVAPGEYEVCVEPENDCGPGTEQCINVVVIDIQLTAEAFDVACLGEDNGYIELTIDGGIPPYSFVWTKDASPTSLSIQNPGGLAPGEYQVTVTDKYGCVATSAPITITEPSTEVGITASSITDEASPGAADGAIDITVTGGTPAYSYLWSKKGDPSFIATTQNISNLTGGTYTVLITDENGCTLEESFTVNQIGGPLQISAIIATDVLCHGEATGTINLEVIGGTEPYSFTWIAGNGGQVPTGQENNQDLTGLLAGTYTVTITDSGTADPIVAGVIISEPAAALTVIATPSDISCYGANDGSISLDVSGGTTPYSYLWGNGSTSESLNNLSAGTYSVTVTDTNGCFFTETAAIAEPAELIIDGVVTASSCDDNSSGSIVLTVSGGTGAYTYSWTGPDGFTSTDEDISNLAPGTYSVAVTDAEGCTTGKSFVVRNTCISIEKILLSGPANNGDGTYNLAYQLTVKNTGNTNLSEIQVTEDLGATFGTFDNVSISSSKFTVNAAYTGTSPNIDLLNASQTLTPGEEGRINISLRVTPGAFNNPYENTVTATAEDSQGVSTEDTATEEVNFAENPLIGLAKAVTDGPFINEDGSYDLSFIITVRNYGDVPLNNVQISDNLDNTFGAGAYTVNTVSTTTGLTPNAGFNGSGDQNLLTGNDVLAVNQIESITLDLTVTPNQLLPFENQASGTANGPGGTTVSDLSQEGTNPDPDNDGDPTNNDDPTVITFTENPGIGLAKRLLGTPVNNNDGTYTLSFEFLVKNTGDAGLAEVQIFDDLDAVFAGKLVSLDNFSSAFFTANPSFDGDTDKNILAGTDILAVGEEETLQLTITVAPGNNLGPYNNTAEASATSLFGSTVTDTSHDGVDVDPDNTGPENHSDPTPVSFTENPQITANKTVADVINNGDLTYDVVYAIEISNTGNVPLSNIQAADDLSITFAGAVSFTVTAVTAPGFDVNNDYNGTSDINLLSGTGNTLAFGESKSIQLTVRVTPGTNLGEYVNTVSVTADSPAGTPATDDSVGVTFSENPVLGLAKELISVMDDGFGTYTVTYVIYAENMGDVPLTNIQIVDDLEEAFEPIGTENWSVVSIDSNDFTLDGDYDGTTLKSEILTGVDELLPGESGTVTLVATITPGFYNQPLLNSATGIGQSPALQFVIDLSQDGDDPAPDGSGNPVNFSDPTPVEFPNVIIGATKRVTEGHELLGDGVFSVTYEVRAQNLGDLTLFDVQVYDRLDVYNSVSDTTGFGTYVNTIAELLSPGQYTLADGPEIIGGSASNTFTINPAFTGAGTATALFTLGAGSNTLLPNTDPISVFGQDVVVSFTIQFIPPGGFLAFYNQAFASGDKTETGTAEGNTTDPSNDGTEMFEDASSPFPNQSLENDDLWENNTPTVFELNDDANLAITKTVDDETPNVGDNITFTITVFNAGPSNATGVEVTDELPGGLTYVFSTTSQGSYDETSGIWTIGTVTNLATVTLTITATVTVDAPPSANNIAQITTSDQNDPDPDNNVDNQEITPQQSDLVIEKTVDNATPNVGDQVTFTVTVTNNGPDAATGVSVEDVVPNGYDEITAISNGGTLVGSTITWSGLSIAPGASLELTFDARVLAPGPGVSYLNTATITDSNQFDPEDVNNEDDVEVTPQQANLAIAKTVDDAAPKVGDPVTFTIAVTNNGPDAATGVEVTDQLPAGLDHVSDVPSQGSYDNGSGLWTIGTIANGATVTLTITATVTEAAIGGVINTATITTSDQYDPDDNNNEDEVGIDPVLEPSIAFVKAGDYQGGATATVGDQILYTFTVTNTGNVTVSGIKIDDATIGVTDLPVIPAVLPPAAVGVATFLYSITQADIDAGVVTNTAIASGTDPQGGTVTDTSGTDPGNDDPTETPLPQEPALAVNKTASSQSYVLNDVITYTIEVTNTGNVTLTDIVVDDPLLTNITLQNIGTLAPGATHTLTGTYTIDLADMEAGEVENIATATGTFNDTPYTSSGSETITAIRADLSINKQGPNTVVAGEEITYTITVNNLGPNTAENIQIVDEVPASIASPVYSTDNFATSQPWASPLSISDLPSGESYVVRIRGTVKEDIPLGSVISNTAIVDSDTFDQNEDNNSSTKETDVNTSADLRIEKLVSSDPVVAGTVITYTLTVTNDGPSAAQAVQVTDNVPSGILSVTFSTDDGASWNPWSSPYAYGTLEMGDSFSFQIRGTVNPALADGSTLTNTASVSSSTPDPDTDDNTSTVGTTVDRVAELSITKSQVDPEELPNISEINPSEAAPGTRIYYLLIVENFGPSYATDAVVTDNLPTGISNPQFSLNFGNSWFTWNGIRNLDNFEFPGINQILIRGDLDPSLTGTITNTATITSPSAIDDEEATVVTELIPEADLSITKEVIGGTVSKTETITYRLRINNNGPSAATNIEVEDIIHPDIVDVEYSLDGETGWLSWTGSVNVGSLQPEDPALTLFIKGIVKDQSPDENTNPIPNTATVTSAVNDPNEANNTTTIYTPLEQAADLALTKTGPDNIVAGTTITYTITVKNESGTFDSENVVVEDIINPARIINAEYSFDQAGWTSWTNSLSLGTLSPTETITFYIRGIVASDLTGTITNNAEVFSSTPDPNIENDIGTVTTTISREADMEIVKLQIDPSILPLNESTLPEDLQELSIDPMEVTAGETIYYLLVYTNNGPSDATNVVITDNVPNVIENQEASRCQANFVPYTGNTSNVGTVVADRTCILLIRGTVRADATGVITNTATIASDVADPNNTNDSSTIVTPVVGSADLLIQKTGTPNPVVAGEEITYTITVENIGPSDALDVRVSDDIDERILDPEYSLDGGSTWADWTGELSLGTVTNTATVSFQIRGTVNPNVPQTNQIENTATVSSTLTPDPNPNNNSSTATNSVNRLANLEITKSADPEPVIPGQTLTYTITVENPGPSDARSVVVTDNLPAALLSISATTTEGTWTAPNWTIGDMAAGSTQTLTITATVGELADGSSLVNTAEVDSTTNDPEEENNTSTVTSTITASPQISLNKTADQTADVKSGETITYTYVITNAGDVAINNITLVDDHSGTGALSAFSPALPVATLAVGASITFTATYEVTQADIDAQLTIVNTATATASFAGVDYSASDGETVTVETASATIAIAKTGTLDMAVVLPADRIDAGDQVNYTFRVENTGNVTLNSVEVTDLNTAVTVNNPNIGTLAPGAVVTITGSYTLTQADMDAGVFSNTATASGNGGAVSNDDSDIQNLQPEPEVAIVKTAEVSGTGALGDAITYTFTVQNKGNVTLTDVTVTDDLPGLSSITPASVASLAPEGVATFSATYTITQADVDAGKVENQALVTANDPVGTVTSTSGTAIENNDPTVTPLDQNPDIALVKTASVGGTGSVNDEITYTFTVHNTGDVTLTNVLVTDDLQGLSAIDPVSVTSLAPNATTTFTATYSIKQEDMDAGNIENHALATGTEPDGIGTVTSTSGTAIENNNPTVTILNQNPEIALIKASEYQGDPNGAEIGDQILYTFTVENTGNVTVSGLTIDDTDIGVTGLVVIPDELAPTATGVVTFLYSITQADIDAGEVENSALASGTDPQGGTVTDTSGTDANNDDPTVTDLPQDPSIALVKTGVYNASSGIINYSFTVMNNGNVTIENILINDARINVSDLAISTTTLAPGESGTATAAYPVTQADIDAGVVSNTATATGQDPNDADVTDTSGTDVDNDDPTVTTIDQHPEIALVKEGEYQGGTAAAMGDEILYTFTVENTGNVTVSGLKIDDSDIGVNDLVVIPDELAPGEIGAVTILYTITQEDIDAGELVNSALASGSDPQGGTVTDTSGTDTNNDDPTVTNLPQDPSIALVKAGTYDDVSGEITYTFTVTNNGNVTIESIVIDDAPIGVSNLVVEPSTLAPGASGTATAVYAVSQADRNAGAVTNTATATGQDTQGNNVTDDSGTAEDNDDPTVTQIDQNPEIALVKEGSYDALSGDITYTFTVTNTGDVTISDIVINDAQIDVIDLVISPATLAPGESGTATVNYIVTQDDIDAGAVTNTAIAAGSDPKGGTVTDTSGTTAENDDPTVTPIDQNPEIALVKEGTYDAAEGEITYTFTVTNNGNVTIENIVIDDVPIGVEDLAITPSALAPGESGSATYVYSVTQADIDDGSLTNQALATGKDPNGDDVTDLSGTDVDNDDHTVTDIDQNPQIALVKTGSYNADTGEITYSFTVHNTGNVTISDIVINDTQIGVSGLGITPSTLAPNAIGIATAVYAVTLADFDAGVVSNTAIASGTDPQGGTVTDTSGTDTDNDDPTETNVPQEPGIVLVKEGEFQGGTPAELGDQILYTFTVYNTGNVTLWDVTVTDELTGLSAITPASIASLVPETTATFSATYTITQADIDAGEVENQALAAGNDPVGIITNTSGTAINNDDPTVTGIAQNADLTLVKTASPDTFVAVGDIITYTFTIENTGNVTISDITLDDPLIDGITDLAIGDLAPGGVHTEVHTYVITSGDLSAGSVVNTATATGTAPDNEPVEASESVTAEAISADLAITKTVSPETLVAGEEVTYTIVVTNNGPIDAVNAVITENIPAGLSKIAVNTTIGSWIAPEWEIGNMPVGETQTMTINATLDADFTGDINNEAFVISDTPDPVMVNNSSSTESQTETSADVEIVKTQVDHYTTMNVVDPPLITAGTKIYYRLLVTNYGPSFAQNTLITDNLPTGLTNAEYSLNNGASWDPWNGTRTLNPFVFPGVNDILIRADLATDATGSLENVATVSSTTADPVLSNNSSEVTTTINTEADLTLTKVANTAPVIKGETISYTLTVTNLGPSDAQDVVITDVFDPDNITGVEYFDGSSWLSWSGSINISSLAYDDTYTLVLQGNVKSDAEDVIPNTATVTSSTHDPNPDNNSRTINTPVDAEADLEIIKTGPSEVVAGEEVSWVITVTNHGPSNASGVLVIDNLPPSLTSRTFSTDGGNTWNPWTGSLNMGEIVVGGTVSFTLKADIAPNATGVLNNTATVSSDVPDPVPGNNSTTTASNINVVADLEVYKIQIDPSIIPVDEDNLPDDINDWAVNDPTLEPLDEIYYLIVYGNKGPSDATNVVVEDILPEAIIDAESSRCQAGFVDWGGSTTVGSITAGEKCVIIIRGTISPTFTGTIANTATISSTFIDTDPDMDNNSSTFVTEIIRAPVNVEAWVYLEGASVVPGKCGEYTLNQPGGLMRTDLNELRLLPGQTSVQEFYHNEAHTTPFGQPYNVTPWNYSGNEGAIYNSTGSIVANSAGYGPDVVDWVLVSLREEVDGPPINNCRAAGLLRNNGRIVFDDQAFDSCELVVTNEYYLVIEHRNHLKVMSPHPIEFRNNVVGWDFRMQQSYISNGTAVGQKPIPGGLFVMFGGNGDQSNEANGIIIDISDRILWQGQNGTINRYRIGDYDMNGDTNYNDRNLWQNNDGESTSVPWAH